MKCRTCKQGKEKIDFYWKKGEGSPKSYECKSCIAIGGKKRRLEKKKDLFFSF